MSQIAFDNYSGDCIVCLDIMNAFLFNRIFVLLYQLLLNELEDFFLYVRTEL